MCPLPIHDNAQHMLWMLDEYETIHGAKYPGFITVNRGMVVPSTHRATGTA